MLSVYAKRWLTKIVNPTQRWQLAAPITALVNDRGTVAYDMHRYRQKTFKSSLVLAPLLLLVANNLVLPAASSFVLKPTRKVLSRSPPASSPTCIRSRSTKAPFGGGYFFEHKTVIIPHDEKKEKGGEDAATTSARWLVVADGVGGSARHNVNPGDYSRALTRNVVELGTEDDKKSGGKAGTTTTTTTTALVDIVHQADLMAQEEHPIGSATCTTLKLTGPTEITTLNIGDSGYSIHRRENGELKVLYVSEPGQHEYNYPHQLGGWNGDEAKKVGVEMTHTDVGPDDIIVVYSDGVSDNMDPIGFHSCLEHAMEDHHENDNDTTPTATARTNIVSLSLAADYIAKKSYFLGKDKEYNSPFAQKSSRYRGGKPDDITVVVAQIRAGDVALFVDADPYFQESITLYKGPIGQVEDLPTLKDLMKPPVNDE